jgi:hypothetical protein
MFGCVGITEQSYVVKPVVYGIRRDLNIFVF